MLNRRYFVISDNLLYFARIKDALHFKELKKYAKKIDRLKIGDKHLNVVEINESGWRPYEPKV